MSEAPFFALKPVEGDEHRYEIFFVGTDEQWKKLEQVMMNDVTPFHVDTKARRKPQTYSSWLRERRIHPVVARDTFKKPERTTP